MQNNNNVGRTMMEMLGVLAIIGVLSIGAINGFQTAMMRYRLGQTQNWINTMRFVFADTCVHGNSSLCQNHYTDTLLCSQAREILCPKGRLKTPMNEAYGLTYSPDLNSIFVYFGGLDERSCKAVIDYDWYALNSIAEAVNWKTERVQAPNKHLTSQQKENMKKLCPIKGQYLVLRFDTKS